MKELQEMNKQELKYAYSVSQFIAIDLSFKITNLTVAYNPKYFLNLDDYLAVCSESEREEIKETIELYTLHKKRYVEAEEILRSGGYGDGGLYSVYSYICDTEKWNENLLMGKITIKDIIKSV